MKILPFKRRMTLLTNDFKFIGTYLCQQTTSRIYSILSPEESKHFNINDYYYLMMIYQMESPTLSHVATMLNLTKPTISALVKRLQNNGLIEKVQSLEDKRIYYLKITSKGKQLLVGDDDFYEHLSKLIIASIEPEQTKALKCLLQVITTILKADI